MRHPDTVAPAVQAVANGKKNSGLQWLAVAILIAFLTIGFVRVSSDLDANQREDFEQGIVIASLSQDSQRLREELAKKGIDPNTIAPSPEKRTNDPLRITGPTGETGPMGAQGPMGLTGARGLTGLKGDKGGNTQGIQGIPGQSIQGDRGTQGDKGDKGDVGDAGTPGAPGAPGAASIVAGPIGVPGQTPNQMTCVRTIAVPATYDCTITAWRP